jgi:hypothetical protein
MATYTIGNDGDDYVSWTALQGATPEAAGDTVSFRKGETFREQITVPASGSSGNEITYTAHGSGADPIIKGSDLVSTWTAYTTLGSDLVTDGDMSNAGSWTTGASWTIAGGLATHTNSGWEYIEQAIAGDVVGVTYRLGYTNSNSGEENTLNLASSGNFGSQTLTNTDGAQTDDLVCTNAGANLKFVANTLTIELDDVSLKYVPTNIWQATLTTEPEQVFFDGTRGTLKSSLEECLSQYDWYWAANVLYTYAASDPDTLYTSPGVEADVRAMCMRIDAKNYIDVGAIHFSQANNMCIYLTDGSDNININGATVSYAYKAGIHGWDDDKLVEDITIQNCTVNYCGGTGIYPVGYCKNWTIASNTVHQNAVLDIDDTGEASHQDSGGIRAGVDATNVTNITIESNTIYDNGTGVSNASVGHGITIDTVGSGIVIRYNKIYDNIQLGIVVEVTTATQIYYNILYDNVTSGIRLSRDCHDNLIYNNVIDGSAAGIEVLGDDTPLEGNMTGNLVKNNISSGNTTRELRCIYGGENDGTYGSGNVYTYNCLGAESSNFIEWGNANYDSTYADWESSYGSVTNSVQVDPLMTDPGNDDFTLQVNSQCRDRGTNVSLTRDYAGTVISPPPSVGAYDYQNANVAFVGNNW